MRGPLPIHPCPFRSQGVVPGDAAEGHPAVDVALQRPLAQVHDVGGLVDAHHAVRRASGQLQPQLLGCKLDIRHRRPAVHQARALDPVRLATLPPIQALASHCKASLGESQGHHMLSEEHGSRSQHE